MRSFLKNSSLFILLWIWMSLVTGTTIAQTLYVGPSSSLYVENNNTVYVNKNIYVDGTIQNKGVIMLTGDLTVINNYVSTGREYFIGTGNQYITNPIIGSNNLGHLIKSNSTNIIADGDFNADSITFNTDGLIDLSGGQIATIKTGGPGAIIGYGPTKYFKVDDNTGELKMLVNSLNTYTFPIGNSTAGYHRIDLNFSSLGTTGGDYVSVKTVTNPGTFYFSKFYPSGFSGNFPNPCIPGINAQWVEFTCLKNDFWRFNGPNDYIYTAYGHTNACGSGLGPRRIFQSSNATNDWLGFAETVVGTITDAFCQYSDWTGSALIIPGEPYKGVSKDLVIAAGYGPQLPVELVEFSARPINNEFIRLNWQTVSELNNKGFYIERSLDAVNWERIDWVDGYNNSNKIQNYEFDDYGVNPEILYYYRLYQLDYSQKYKISTIVSAKINGFDVKISNVFPNPGNNDQYLPIFLPVDTPITISCLNALGQQIWDKKINGKTGNQNILLENVSIGMYILKININDKTFTKKYIKQ